MILKIPTEVDGNKPNVLIRNIFINFFMIISNVDFARKPLAIKMELRQRLSRPRRLSFSALNLLSVCPIDHYCLDSNPVSKGNVFASSEQITFTAILACARPSAYQDINMVLLGVKSCVTERYVCLHVWYIASLQVTCLHFKSKQGLTQPCSSSLSKNINTKHQVMRNSKARSIPRINIVTNKPDKQTW